MQERLFFLHIPKTAGMSVHRMLEKAVTPYTHLQHPHELAWPAALVWSRFRGCGGHLTGISAVRHGFMDGYTVTFLREPVARFLSQYNFSLSPAFGNFVDGILSRKYAIPELLEFSKGYLGSFWNAQTYALSDQEYTASPEEHLVSALANLERFVFIGVTESFAQDATDLVRCLGGKDVAIPHENRSERQAHPELRDPAVCQLLANSQALDFVLYRRAIELRDQRRRAPRYFQVSQSIDSVWPPNLERTGTGQAEITRLAVLPADGRPDLRSGSTAELAVHWTADCAIPDLTVGLRIEDAVGNYIVGTNSSLLTGCTLDCQPGNNCSVFRFALNMGPGRYVLSVALHQNAQRLCWLDAATVFEILACDLSPQEGLVNIAASFLTAPSSAWQPLPEEMAPQVMLQLRELTSGPFPAPLRIPVHLQNPTDNVLSSSVPSLTFLTYHWTDALGQVVVFDGARTPLPSTIGPHQQLAFDVLIDPPPSPGRWILQIRIVQEFVRWHEGPEFEAATPPDLPITLDSEGRYTLHSPAGRQSPRLLSRPFR